MAPKTEDRLSPSLWVTGAPHPAWPGGRGRPQPRPSLAGASFPVRPAECGGAQRQRPCTVAAVLLWPAPARVGGAGGCAGANSYGQLGLGHKEDVFLPQQLNDFCKPVCVRRIAGGGGHSAVVTDGGSLFVCGLNKDGQLGLGHTEDVLYFTPCKSLIGCPIQQVACGWDFTIILTENGQVLSCGSNSFGQLGVPHGPGRCVVPQAIELLREEVVSIAAGLRHALAATASGIVFQWGTGLASSGRRLCPGQTLPLFLTAKEPSRVPGLENSKAICVVAGSDHSASLAETGKVFTWGRADYGQLGRKLESEEGWRPEKQGSPLPCSRPWESTPSSLHCLTGATEISCGSEHNLAVIGGACYSWGWNEQGMCGDGSEADVQAPKPVQALQSSPGLLVGCGAGHSLALCQLPALPSPDASEDAKSQEATDKATGRKDNQDHLPKATLTGAEIGGL
ncbi:PREDICTED: secretion-regulating guanine nucleotide exchange factor isoform X5 [Myotis brandtii]|uniref:secretion-regulating guanine nucleotide exchange factor isoform X5 n=1 Tax=Myotis brandtii TaxID=109478 RepID=UPI0007044C5E|nr:PREDICTED: secretion-regulating guanine nucleotide exchange factor isoform X5 [Myotis brandtii]